MSIPVSRHHPPTLDQYIFNPFPNIGPVQPLEHQKFEGIRTNCKYFSTANVHEIKKIDQNFSILHVNARSLLSDTKFEEFKIMLFRTGKIWDIICVSETWLQNGTEHRRCLDGYKCFFEHRLDQIGGGVAIYINELRINNASQMKRLVSCTQTLFVEVCLCNSVSLIIGQIYRPPNLDSSLFVDELENALESLCCRNKQILICGDFNFDLFNTNINGPVQEFFNTFSSSGFWPLISKATRVSNQSLSLLDNIYCNDLSLVKNSGLLIDDTTDHFPVFTQLDLSPMCQQKSEYVSRFDFKKIPEFKEHLRSALTDFENITDPDLASHTLISAYQSGIQKFSCYRKVNRKDCPLKPWITPAILNSINKRCKLFTIKQKFPTECNKLRYTRYRNVLNSVIRMAKKDYIESQLDLNKNNSKRMWETLLTYTKGLSVQNLFPDSFCGKGNTNITVPHDIANEFNLYFSTVAKNLQDEIPCSPDDPLEFVKTCQIAINTIEPTTPIELNAIVKSMKNVGGGLDGINSKIFKSSYEIIIQELTHFVNICLQNGKFPANLKVAVIKPIFKSGDKQKVSNYRPISILPFISKIMEKIIYNRLLAHLDAHNILCSNQFGFRKKLSTYMPLLLLQENISKAFENNRIVCGLYLDLKKAFDTVDHKILLSKISRYGVKGVFLNLLTSYLTDRIQCVQYKNAKSTTSKVNIGVPQGSILGPLLFVLYVNDFPEICANSTCLLYADDTAIFFEAQSQSELQKQIDNDLPKIVNWFNSNKLSINASKTYCQLYNNTTAVVDVNVSISNERIKFTDQIKYLGMYIDSDMKWRSHINHITSILSRNVGIIKKSSFFLKRKHLLLLYNSLFLPYINYCCIIWGHTAPTLLLKLNKIKKK